MRSGNRFCAAHILFVGTTVIACSGTDGNSGSTGLGASNSIFGGSSSIAPVGGAAATGGRPTSSATTVASAGGNSNVPVGGTSNGITIVAQGGNTSVTTSAAGSGTAKGGSTAVATTLTGGTATAGGTTAKGGTTAASTGGTTAKGGSTGVGGTTAKGGTTAAGGISSNGGTSTTGGTTAAGGSVGLCGADYAWPTYSPNIAYDYQDEYGVLAKPTKDSSDVTGIAGRYSKDWWTFVYGANKNSLVTSAAWIPMVDRFNTDFGYITDTMRWPRDSRARAGYYSAIYLYGSGLSSDTASNTELGGWQSSAGNGPMVLASYYPVYSFDPACTYNDKVTQQGAMIHEGIHCILASMPGCKKACWFQEGGNTWLQATMTAKRGGTAPTSMGFLSAGAAIAPFIPIESYSGWLQDGSFGGPCAERVNMNDSSGKQICTWRNLLGGNQYGETFPHAMEVILGEKSIAWIWRNASKSGRVLQDLAEVTGGIGATQTMRLIQEYRARQAFGDFGIWKTAYKKLLNDNWNTSIGPEWSPYWINVAPWKATSYVVSTVSGSTLTPDPLTLPGWSGANQIPLTLSAGASCATVTFNPTGADMSCQIVYQDTTGNVHYGAPVTSGACTASVSNVKNNVVIAVISNSTYIYDGGTTKYAYTLTLGTGIAAKADVYTQWYK